MTAATFRNSCKFNATAGGTVDFVVASAFDANHSTPEQSSVVDGKTYLYYAQSSDGLQWESGFGVYTISSHTLTRVTIIASTNAGAKVNFTLAPPVDVFPSPSSTLEQGQVPGGTLMLFQQSSAPLGWTKQTTHNDKALRVVSGTASSGGTNAFSTVMAQTTVGNHTLSTGEMPSHAHTPGGGGSNLTTTTCGPGNDAVSGATGGSQGGGGVHTHPITMSIAYVDLIICQKN